VVVNVGQVAAAAGVSVRTLDHWDAVGLLVPSGRTAAGYRTYAPGDLERLQERRRAGVSSRGGEELGHRAGPHELREVFGDEDPTQHAEEARERWADTDDAYRQSHARTSSYSKQDWLEVKAEGEDVERRFAERWPPGCRRTTRR
jgi:DNA-binding transcriptional MerR regulator